jgi:hypothetical protein
MSLVGQNPKCPSAAACPLPPTADIAAGAVRLCGRAGKAAHAFCRWSAFGGGGREKPTQPRFRRAAQPNFAAYQRFPRLVYKSGCGNDGSERMDLSDRERTAMGQWPADGLGFIASAIPFLL